MYDIYTFSEQLSIILQEAECTQCWSGTSQGWITMYHFRYEPITAFSLNLGKKNCTNLYMIWGTHTQKMLAHIYEKVVKLLMSMSSSPVINSTYSITFLSFDAVCQTSGLYSQVEKLNVIEHKCKRWSSCMTAVCLTLFIAIPQMLDHDKQS